MSEQKSKTKVKIRLKNTKHTIHDNNNNNGIYQVVKKYPTHKINKENVLLLSSQTPDKVLDPLQNKLIANLSHKNSVFTEQNLKTGFNNWNLCGNKTYDYQYRSITHTRLSDLLTNNIVDTLLDKNNNSTKLSDIIHCTVYNITDFPCFEKSTVSTEMMKTFKKNDIIWDNNTGFVLFTSIWRLYQDVLKYIYLEDHIGGLTSISADEICHVLKNPFYDTKNITYYKKIQAAKLTYLKKHNSNRSNNSINGFTKTQLKSTTLSQTYADINWSNIPLELQAQLLETHKAQYNVEVKTFPNLISKIRGGLIKIQGSWLPYDICLHLCSYFCYSIRFLLIPIFGNDFPKLCEDNLIYNLTSFVSSKHLTNNLKKSNHLIGMSNKSAIEPTKINGTENTQYKDSYYFGLILMSMKNNGGIDNEYSPINLNHQMKTLKQKSKNVFCLPLNLNNNNFQEQAICVKENKLKTAFKKYTKRWKDSYNTKFTKPVFKISKKFHYNYCQVNKDCKSAKTFDTMILTDLDKLAASILSPLMKASRKHHSTATTTAASFFTQHKLNSPIPSLSTFSTPSSKLASIMETRNDNYYYTSPDIDTLDSSVSPLLTHSNSLIKYSKNYKYMSSSNSNKLTLSSCNTLQSMIPNTNDFFPSSSSGGINTLKKRLSSSASSSITQKSNNLTFIYSTTKDY